MKPTKIGKIGSTKISKRTKFDSKLEELSTNRNENIKTFKKRLIILGILLLIFIIIISVCGYLIWLVNNKISSNLLAYFLNYFYLI